MDVVIRAAIVYFFLLILMRAVGRRELSEMSSFELVILVVMGDLVQQGVTQEDYSLTGAVLAVGTMALLSVLLGYLGYRWSRVDQAVEGIPAIVFHDGHPLHDVLRAHRVPMDELIDAAREQGIADLNELEFAVLEPDGEFSFVRHDRAQSKPASKKSE